MRRDSITMIVEKIIENYKTRDPFTICDFLNVGVNVQYLGTSHGFYGYSNGMCEIFINSAADTIVRKAVCAHELGHALLHTETNIRFMTSCTLFSEGKFEREADLFAAELLLYGLENRIAGYEDCCYNEIAALEGVPREFIEIKFLRSVM